MTAALKILLIIPFLLGAVVVLPPLGNDGMFTVIKVKHPQPKCIADSGAQGVVKAHTISTLTTGRLAIGDLTGNRHPEFVVSNRDQISAYSLCGGRLWTKAASTNWDIGKPSDGGSKHVWWNWSSYGLVFKGKFLHIGADWRTLYVRNGKTGAIEKQINLGDGKWTYIVASDDKVFVTEETSFIKVQAFNSSFNRIWNRDHGYRLSQYIVPAIGDINGDGCMDIVQTTAAINGCTGQLIWITNLAKYGQIGAHTLNLVPYGNGMAAVFSLYSPKQANYPSLVIILPDGTEINNYNAGHHPHQHTVGDFIPGGGIEALVRSDDGKSHWLFDPATGNNLKFNLRKDPGWGGDGEIVVGIEWDGLPGDEVLYIQRHVAYAGIPKLRIVNGAATKLLTPMFHGGYDPDPTLYYHSPNSWTGWMDRGDGPNEDGPYEGGAWVFDVFGDGREEIVTIKPKQIVIYYNSGKSDFPSQWEKIIYQIKKRLNGQVYGPR